MAEDDEKFKKLQEKTIDIQKRRAETLKKQEDLMKRINERVNKK